ncbi:MAG: SDR family NAD(P)-dependent oxidoreductase [Acidimicrobiales bacterium]|nr:SDR family NAD(P)-dependent oxidoreductase [Acidimicrobiales bacterium]MCB1247889.1 SDR family NAD(P)-dependent oxidoreductase [Acidimicrobiales bacterium]
MEDALGSVQRALVLGGTSEIALAVLERLARDRCRSAVLAVRDPHAAAPAVERLARAGIDDVTTVAFDAAAPEALPAVIDEIFDAGDDIDLVLVAFGVLGDQADFDADPVAAGRAVTVNYTAAVTSGLATAARLRAQGHGTLCVLSSVAAERPRQTNYVYGSSKAGLDAFAQGLGDALEGSGARVMVVRPGFVHTRMTEGMAAQPFSTTPEVVADAVAKGLGQRRHTVWAPGILRVVFAVMRHLPRPVWRIISAR